MVKSIPNCFTPMAELQVDWPRVLKRLSPRYRGLLLSVNKKHLMQMSRSFKYPVVLIPHLDYKLLNVLPGLLTEITGAINLQNVHRLSGVQFIAPVSPEQQELIDRLIDTLDAEVIDVEDRTQGLLSPRPDDRERIPVYKENSQTTSISTNDIGLSCKSSWKDFRVEEDG